MDCEETLKPVEGQDWVTAKNRGDCMRPFYTSNMDAAWLICPKNQVENKTEGDEGFHNWVAQGRQGPRDG